MCTGFGLAAMINFLNRGKGIDTPVSERMLYEMAKRHDRWPGKEAKQPGHILLYAHGGLNSVKGGAARVGKWAQVFEANAIRQIHFIWETGFLASLKDILLGKDQFAKERTGGFTDWTDTLLESATQPIGRDHP